MAGFYFLLATNNDTQLFVTYMRAATYTHTYVYIDYMLVDSTLVDC